MAAIASARNRNPIAALHDGVGTAFWAAFIAHVCRRFACFVSGWFRARVRIAAVSRCISSGGAAGLLAILASALGGHQLSFSLLQETVARVLDASLQLAHEGV